MDSSIIEPLLDWVARHEVFAGFVIFFVAAAESLAIVGILVPGIAFMLGIGALVGLQSLPLASTLLWAMAGAVAGDSLSYWLGRHFDKQLLAIWPLSRYPQLIPRGERFFKRHGGKSILFGRFVGPLRPIIPFVAGMMHMPPGRFLLFNIVSAILWAPAVILPGLVFGKSIHLASDVLVRLIIVVAATIILFGIVGWVIRKLYLVLAAETIDTWTAFLVRHMGMTGLASIFLFAVLTASVGVHLFKTGTYQGIIVFKQDIQAERWWNETWQNMPVFQNNKIDGQPISIQSWGTLTDLRQRLLAMGWEDAEPLTVKNALNYFSPTLSAANMPVRSYRFQGRRESLLMRVGTGSSNQVVVIRFWQAQPHHALAGEQLWLGSVDTVTLLQLYGGINVPVQGNEFRQSLVAFKNDFMLLNKPADIKYTLYERAPVFDVWQGEVLLLKLH